MSITSICARGIMMSRTCIRRPAARLRSSTARRHRAGCARSAVQQLAAALHGLRARASAARTGVRAGWACHWSGMVAVDGSPGSAARPRVSVTAYGSGYPSVARISRLPRLHRAAASRPLRGRSPAGAAYRARPVGECAPSALPCSARFAPQHRRAEHDVAASTGASSSPYSEGEHIGRVVLAAVSRGSAPRPRPRRRSAR